MIVMLSAFGEQPVFRAVDHFAPGARVAPCNAACACPLARPRNGTTRRPGGLIKTFHLWTTPRLVWTI